MLLSDLGADVIRIDRTRGEGFGVWPQPRYDILSRGRRRFGVDLKQEAGRDLVLQLIDSCDALIEGFRPGVAERLGLGPDDCLDRNPRLVYGRMTGWGQSGPLAQAAGHDINYIALTGALHAIGRKGEPPTIPLNVVGDFGGGAMFLALGVVCAMLEATRSGRGQVVDAAMVDGAASLISYLYGAIAAGFWQTNRESNLLDGGAHFYNVYETSDGKYVSVGSIEPQFYAQLVEKSGLGGEDLPDQNDMNKWPAMKNKFAAVFKTKTRDEWAAIMEGSEVCFAPVLTAGEAVDHPQLKARGTFVEIEGVPQPAPAPRFSRSPGSVQRPPQASAAQTAEILEELGLSATRIDELRITGVVA
jgi:alpha-methylacyl-CoA racemase